MKQRFAIKSEFVLLWIPGIALAMRLGSPLTADASFLVVAIYAFFGNVQVIHSLLLCWLFQMLSDGVAPVASSASIGRYLVVLAAGISVLSRGRLLRGRVKRTPQFALTLLLGAFLLAHSVIFSPSADVSILKSGSWLFTFLTLTSAWDGMDAITRRRVEGQLIGALIALMLASLPLIGSEAGYLRNGLGFQGILNHPQAFGPMVAMLAVWLGALFLTDRKRPSVARVLALALCIPLVVLSEARTAGLAMVIGLVVPLIAAVMYLRSRTLVFLPGLGMTRSALAAISLTAVALVSGSSVGGAMEAYLSKRDDADSVISLAEASRGVVVYPMLKNIEAYPITGIGFGIASVPSLRIVERESVSGLPISAAAEKGVLPIMVLEEIGVIGFSLVLIWLTVHIRAAIRSGFVETVVMWTALLTNLGEATFFSSGGMGLLLMILFTWAATGSGDYVKITRTQSHV